MTTRSLLPVAVPILVLAFCTPPSVSAAMVSTGSASASAGEMFVRPVSVTGVADLYAFQFDLSFDPAILHLQSITEGPFLAAAGTTAFIPGTIDNSAGTATFTADTLLGAIPGNSGSGELAEFHFRALSAGISPLTLTNVILLDSGLSDIAHGVENGEVVISAAAVPEPGTLSLLGISLACGVLLAKRS